MPRQKENYMQIITLHRRIDLDTEEEVRAEFSLIKEAIAKNGTVIIHSRGIFPVAGANMVPIKDVFLFDSQHTPKKIPSILFEVDMDTVLIYGNTHASTISANMKYCFDNYGAHGKQITVVKESELKTDYLRYFISYSLLSGCGVKTSGEIGGLYSMNYHLAREEENKGKELIDFCVQQGGQYLECFDTYLPGIYESMGFTTVGILHFDDRCAPLGWDYEAMKDYSDGRPNLKFMVADTVDIHGQDIPQEFYTWDECDKWVKDTFITRLTEEKEPCKLPTWQDSYYNKKDIDVLLGLASFGF